MSDDLHQPLASAPHSSDEQTHHAQPYVLPPGYGQPVQQQQPPQGYGQPVPPQGYAPPMEGAQPQQQQQYAQYGQPQYAQPQYQPYPPQYYPPGTAPPPDAYATGATAYSVVVAGPCAAGGGHSIREEFTGCGLLCGILLFPIGLVCCLTMRNRTCMRCGMKFD